MFLQYIIIIEIFVLSELLLDSQDSYSQLISQDKFKSSFSIWFKFIQSQESYDIVSFYSDEDQFFYSFISYNQKDHLQFCLSQNNCIQISNMWQYQNALSWIHIIISSNIKIEQPIKTIVFNSTFSLEYQLILKKSEYYRCLIYDSVSQVKQRIFKLQYDKFVRPPELLELFTEQSSIQIFLKQNLIKYSDKDQELLLVTYKNLFSIQFVDMKEELFKINDDKINYIPNYELNKWFQIQFIINYEIIKFLLMVDDYTYIKEYKVQLGQNIPLYYELVVNLQSNHFIFQSSNYYQFYNSNEITLCHSYCKECNITCQSCYVENCQCLPNQFFNTTNKKCQYYSQNPNIDLTQLRKECQRGFKFNENIDQCELYSFKYEGLLNEYSYFDDNNEVIQFSLIEDLIFRKNFFDSPQEKKINSLQYDQTEDYIQKNFVLLDYQSQLIIKNKNIFIVYRSNDGLYLCRHKYFGNQCQYKMQSCLKSENKNCLFCQPNYILMRNQCKKCPLNCLICDYLKKKMICILQQEGYYLDQYSIVKKCQNCLFCNQLGCVSEQEILNQVQKCDQNRFCYKGRIFSCNHRQQFIYDISSKECQQLSYIQLQSVQSLLYINEKFLGNYESSFIWQLILHSMTFNNTDIFQNYLVSQIFRFEQLRLHYSTELSGELSKNEHHFLQKNGYVCRQKYLHNNSVRCIKYDPDSNLYIQNMDCQENSTCRYNLTLTDVYISIGHISGVFFENQKYDDLEDLLMSIQEVGFDFKYVIINATLIFNRPHNQIEQVYNSKHMLQINKKVLPLQLQDTQFFLNISYVYQGYDISRNGFLLNITADYVQIDNLLVYYTFYLYINCSQLILNNTQVYQSSFTLNIIQGTIIIIQNTLIANIQSNDNIEFNLLNVDQLIYISEFHIIRSQLKSFLFTIKDVLNIKLYKFDIFESSLKYMAIFDVVYVKNIQALDISLDTVNMNSVILFQIIIGHNFILETANINKIFADGFSPLIQIQGFKEASFVNFNIHNSILKISQVLSIYLEEQLMLENIYLHLDANQFMVFIGDTLIINQLKIYQQGSQSIKIFNSRSDKILINVLEYISQNRTLDIQYGIYLIRIVSRIRSLISNIKINNTILTGVGIFYLQNFNFIQLYNISISNCVLQLDSQQFNLFNIDNQGRSIFYNINIQNVSIHNRVNNQPTIFRINGTNDNFFIKNIALRNINSTNGDNVIFQLNNKRIQIVGLQIIDTFNIKFFYLQSQDIQISQIQFINSSLTRYIFFVAVKNQEYTCYINIKDLYVYNLTGYLISNFEIDRNYIIQLEDVHIRLVNFHTVVNLLLMNTILQIKNLFIEEQAQINSLSENQIFVFTYTKVFLQNISITNLSMKFGYIFYPKQIEIKRIVISNVTLVNYDEQYQPFINILIDQTTIISNILIINSTFQDIECLFVFIFRGSLILNDFKIFNVQLNQKLVVLKFFNQSHQVRLNDFIVQNLGTVNLLFPQSELEYSSIFMNNLYISNCSGYILETNVVIDAKLNNSLLINNKNIFNLEQDINLIIQSSEILNHQQLTFLETLIKNSLIYDEVRSEIIVTRPLAISLSFNFGKTLLSTRRLSQNVNQIMVNNNISSFFYLPTGQDINKYQRLQIQQLKYIQIYKGFGIVAQGLDQQKINCNLTSTYKGEEIEVFNQNELILQQGLNIFDNLTSVINPYNSDYVVNEIQCNNYSLRFNTKGFRCQLGEFIYNNQCLQCDISKGLYSTQYNSTHCFNVNYNQIEQLKIGLIKLRQNYWRYNYSTTYIEQCTNQYQCNGGWRPGDSSCNSSRIGPLCLECDVYNHVGNGHYTKNLNSCQICQVTYTLIYQILFSVIWQLLLTFINVYSKDNLSKQFLFYKVGFSNFYQVLYRLSIDQPSVILKMFLNYIFQIYLIRQNFETLGQLLVLNINYMNNPNLIMQAQLDCLFIQVQNVEVIYTQFFFSLCNLFFTLSLQYFIYLVLVKFKATVFSIKFFFLATVETVIFNLKIILEISFKLLSNQEISGIKWITSNLAYKYYTTVHFMWMVNYIIPITCTFILAPILMILLLKLNTNIYIKIQKTFSLFQQAYKNNFFFWEYIIIYVKLVFILISIINREQLQFTTFLCLGLLFALYHYQPYYLKNLNNIDYRLLLFFTIIIQILILTNNSFVISVIFFINIYIIIDVIKLIVRKSIQLNRSIIFDYKSKVTNKFPKLRKLSGLESDFRTISNQKLIKSVIRKKYLSRKNSEVNTKSLIPKHEILSLGQEIELGTIKSANSE